MVYEYRGAGAKQAATDLVRALGADLYSPALPRCDHAKWAWPARAWAGQLRLRLVDRGYVADCPCTDRSVFDPSCPHVTWQHAAVFNRGGQWYVQASPEDSGSQVQIPGTRDVDTSGLEPAWSEANEY